MGSQDELTVQGDADQLLAELPCVSLPELDERASLLRRTDNKYVLQAEDFTKLLQRLAGNHQVLEIEGRRHFAYRSVYFDTPDLRCFRDHTQDRSPRFKSRTRLYADSAQCVFEVKLKLGDGEIDKRQIEHPADRGAELTDQARACVSSALSEVGLTAPDELAPTLQTEFTRVTLASTQGAERATFDFDLGLLVPDGPGARLRPGLVVLETKSEDGDSPADRAVHELGYRPASLSKYRVGISLLVPEADDADGPQAVARFFAVD